MANTLTNVLDVLYSAAINVSREPVALCKLARQDFDDQGAALNQAVKVPIAPAASNADFTPAATTTSGTDATPTTVSVTITKSRKNSWHYTGEEERSILQTRRDLFQQQVEQAMRALVNECEADGFAEARKNASRAYGTAGTTPLSSGVGDLAQVRKILDDNGAPLMNRRLALDTTAGANLRSNTQLTKANEAGTSEILRSGDIGIVQTTGFDIGESAQISVVTKGTGSGYLVNGAAAAGSTTINADTGTGTILAGDIITDTQSGVDARKYVVNTALSAGSFAIGNPGNIVAWGDNDTLAVGNNFTPNIAFHRDALVLVERPPALDANGYIQTELVTDPVSGLRFLVARIEQYGQITWEVHAAWGWKAVQSQHIALLLG